MNFKVVKMSKFNTIMKVAVLGSVVSLMSGCIVVYHDQPKEKKLTVDQEKTVGEDVSPSELIEVSTPLKDFPNPLTKEWVRVNYDQVQERAIKNPKNADGTLSADYIAFLKVQRFVLDYAQDYAQKANPKADISSKL